MKTIGIIAAMKTELQFKKARLEWTHKDVLEVKS